jgi:hypothetical protein
MVTFVNGNVWCVTRARLVDGALPMQNLDGAKQGVLASMHAVSKTLIADYSAEPRSI